jgi:hypothetical protein
MILRYGSVSEWLAVQGAIPPLPAAPVDETISAGRAAVIPPAHEAEVAVPEPAVQRARRPAAGDDVPWTRPRPAPGLDADDEDDLPHWARKRGR